jgi:hypothetical protein
VDSYSQDTEVLNWDYPPDDEPLDLIGTLRRMDELLRNWSPPEDAVWAISVPDWLYNDVMRYQTQRAAIAPTLFLVGSLVVMVVLGKVL